MTYRVKYSRSLFEPRIRTVRGRMGVMVGLCRGQDRAAPGTAEAINFPVLMTGLLGKLLLK